MAYSYDEHMGDPQPAHMGSQSQTGTQVAGEVIQFPISMQQSDQQRINSSKAPPRNPTTQKPILFPGVKD